MQAHTDARAIGVGKATRTVFCLRKSASNCTVFVVRCRVLPVQQLQSAACATVAQLQSAASSCLPSLACCSASASTAACSERLQPIELARPPCVLCRHELNAPVSWCNDSLAHILLLLPALLQVRTVMERVSVACEFSLAEALQPRDNGRCLVQSGASWHRSRASPDILTPDLFPCRACMCIGIFLSTSCRALSDSRFDRDLPSSYFHKHSSDLVFPPNVVCTHNTPHTIAQLALSRESTTVRKTVRGAPHAGAHRERHYAAAATDAWHTNMHAHSVHVLSAWVTSSCVVGLGHLLRLKIH